MDRDPLALVEDLYDLDDAIAALDPQHFWKCNEASGNLADSGYGNIALNVTGSPGYAVATGLTGITGVRIEDTSFFSPASALPASGTTFTIFALVKILHDYVDNTGVILYDHANAVGWHVQKVSVPTFGSRFTTDAGHDESDDFVATVRQLAFLAIVVTAGTARFYLNGVGFDGGDGTDATIATFTPTRVGATASSTNVLRAILSRLVYMPGVALTDEQIADVWSHRYSCQTSTLSVVNTALSHIGQSKALTDLETIGTQGAPWVEARLHWGNALESVLRAYNWPFANRLATLALVDGSESEPVNSYWTYSYRTPDKCIRALSIVKDGQKKARDEDPIPFETGQDALGGLIYTDLADAELEYTLRTSCPAQQGDPWFREALAWYLAAKFVPSLSKNERTVEFCLGMAQAAIDRAATGAANEDQPQDTNRTDPEWLRNR